MQQIARHEKVQTKDEHTLNKDWRLEVNIADKYNRYRPSFLGLLREFETVWDGNIENIKEEVHRI